LIEITEQDFNAKEIIRSLRKEGVGAIVTFIGTVRDFTEVEGNEAQRERIKVKQLIYECYKDMALDKMAKIRDYALVNYDINDMHIVHRTGPLKPSEQIVMIAVSAVHRTDAFKACEFAIDELKKSVPIWKKELTSKGELWVGEEKGKRWKNNMLENIRVEEYDENVGHK
jgi:molybdopterin synthase catalytic subunit